jgi:hypothetical protein
MIDPVREEVDVGKAMTVAKSWSLVAVWNGELEFSIAISIKSLNLAAIEALVPLSFYEFPHCNMRLDVSSSSRWIARLRCRKSF